MQISVAEKMVEEAVVDSIANPEKMKSNAEGLSKAAASVPLSEKDEKDITLEVSRQIEALRSVDIYAEDSDSETSSNNIKHLIQNIFDSSARRRAETAEITNFFTQRNFSGRESTESFKAINDLRDALEKYDPRKFSLTSPERFLGFIPLPGMAKRRVKEYARKFKSAEGHINDIMDGVMSAKDDGVRAITELGVVEKKLLSLAKGLRKQYETFKVLGEKVEEYLSELDERDPIKSAKIRNEIMIRMRQEQMDTLTVLNHAILGVTEVGVLKRTQEMVILACDRVASTGRLILTINQTVAVATSEQAATAEMLTQVNGTINAMTESTAATLKDHTKVMRDLTENPLSAVETLSKAFDDAFSAVDELKKNQVEASEKAKQSVEKLEGVLGKAEERIATEKAALRAMNSAVEAAGEEMSKDLDSPRRPRM